MAFEYQRKLRLRDSKIVTTEENAKKCAFKSRSMIKNRDGEFFFSSTSV